MKRRFGARAQEESLDSAGRLRVPRHLIEHAGLRGPCTVIGATDHVEIWDSERWREQDAEIDATALEIAEGLAGGA
jgi:MraZ protein